VAIMPTAACSTVRKGCQHEPAPRGWTGRKCPSHNALSQSAAITIMRRNQPVVPTFPSRLDDPRLLGRPGSPGRSFRPLPPARVSRYLGPMPLHSADYWDAKAERAARKAQDMQTPAARASMLLIAVLAERVRQTEERLAEADC
jgi:hypothetical protein